MRDPSQMTGGIERCHILEASSAPPRAFASACSKLVPTYAWIPHFKLLPSVPSEIVRAPADDGVLEIINFPLQRGYGRPIIDSICHVTSNVAQWLTSLCEAPENSLLVCTSPFFAPVARNWPGPLVYYSFDLTYAYHGVHAARVLKLDKMLCAAADLVCPVSHRIADYLVHDADCDPGLIQVLPNATLGRNLRRHISDRPCALPMDVQDLPRPIAGVIGNMGDNLDWVLLHETIAGIPELSWLFIGPTGSKIGDPIQRRARDSVMNLGKRVRFIGSRPYQELQAYARALEVAVMPYRLREPTYSGSATRYYEHLAAGRPMIATRNVAELLDKEPLVLLVATAAELVEGLQQLLRLEFKDGLEQRRIDAARHETWDIRAQTMFEALASRGLAKSSGEPL